MESNLFRQSLGVAKNKLHARSSAVSGGTPSLYIGVWPSGRALVLGTSLGRFDSCHSNHYHYLFYQGDNTMERNATYYKNRIAVLQARKGKDNHNIIAKLYRALRKIEPTEE